MIHTKLSSSKMQASERGNYSLDVLERISNLKFIENDLQTRGDEFKQLVNVKALLQAYRSHTLDWIDGLVTYWSRGKQLCEPRPLYWAEFEAINREHKGYESFWVEGVSKIQKPCHGLCFRLTLTLLFFSLGERSRSQSREGISHRSNESRRMDCE